MSEYIYDDETLTRNSQCVICHDYGTTPLNQFERTEKCKVHHRPIVCEKYEYVCPQYEEFGWYSTAGFWRTN